MFFPRLIRRAAYQGAAGIYTYRRYKEEIVEDCHHRCVYCDGHGSSFGGPEMMELDHFRPKAKHLFPELRHSPHNLVLACRSCNGKKRDDWPAGKDREETHHDGLGYIDPFFEVRTDYFRIEDDGSFCAVKDPASYMIEQLCLNRRFAVAIRARRILRQKLDSAITELLDILDALADRAHDAAEIKAVTALLREANRELQILFDENFAN